MRSSQQRRSVETRGRVIGIRPGIRTPHAAWQCGVPTDSPSAWCLALLAGRSLDGLVCALNLNGWVEALGPEGVENVVEASARAGLLDALATASTSRRLCASVIDKHGHRKFTPRAAVSYRFETPVRCATGDPGELRFSGNEFNMYGYFFEPLRNGLFSHKFEDQFEQPPTAPLEGYVKGNGKTRRKRGGRVVRSPRINGSIHVTDWDPAPGIADCTTTEFYSATPCKRRISPKAPKYDRWKSRKMPVCKQTW
jgi:hypothetical protein